MALQVSAGDPLVFFSAVAALLFLGFLGNLLFDRLRLNDTILLILVGVALGPVFHVVEPETLKPATAIIGALALILILFDGGLTLRFRDLVHGLAPATVLAIGGFVLTTVGVGAVVASLLGAPILVGCILGAILGGTSSVIVMPSLQFIPCKPRTATLLTLESALTDVFVVVAVFTLVGIAVAGQSPDAQGIASDVVLLFALSLMGGGAAGLVWLWLLPRVRDKPFGYMLTLGAAFTVYVVVEWLLSARTEGGGPLAVLAFGIVLGNAHDMGAAFRERIGTSFGGGLKRFQGELVFLVRTFFFVYLGLLVDLTLLADLFVIAVGILVFAVLAAARFVAVALANRRLRFGHEERVQWVLLPRGLACAVMAGVPAQAGVEGAETFVAIAFLIVVLSNITTTIGGFALGRGSPLAAGDAPVAAQARRPASAALAARQETGPPAPARKPRSPAR